MRVDPESLAADVVFHVSRFDDAVAERWGQIEAAAKKQRKTLPTVDAQLAATALHHGLTFVARNTSHVESTGATVFNPWDARHSLPAGGSVPLD